MAGRGRGPHALYCGFSTVVFRFSSSPSTAAKPEDEDGCCPLQQGLDQVLVCYGVPSLCPFKIHTCISNPLYILPALGCSSSPSRGLLGVTFVSLTLVLCSCFSFSLPAWILGHGLMPRHPPQALYAHHICSSPAPCCASNSLNVRKMSPWAWGQLRDAPAHNRTQLKTC